MKRPRPRPRPSPLPVPPITATRILERLLPVSEREDTIGDLAERFHRHHGSHGTAAARRWYWKQTLTFLGQLSRERVRKRLDRLRAGRTTFPGLGASDRGITISYIAQDVRYALRTLSKNPIFSLIAVATLSLGMGATTAVFTILHSIVLTPLPYHEPEQLVRLYQAYDDRPDDREFVAGLDFLDFREQDDVFQDLASLYTYRERGLDLTGAGGAKRVRALPVSAGYFEVFRASPLLGRTFRREDERPDAALVILSYRLWKDQTNSDRDIVGQSFTLNGAPYTVVGVMRPNFLDVVAGEVDVWVPENLIPKGRNSRNNHYLTVIGRLQPDVTISQAQARLDVVTSDLAIQVPQTNEGAFARLYPLFDEVVGQTDTLLYILMGAAALVLLIACVNVANLFLARSLARRKELAVRAALGSGRARIAYQLFTESLVIAALGGAAGLMVTVVAVKVLLAVSPESLARADEVSFDPMLLAFTASVTILTGLFFGMAPAIQSSRVDLSLALRDGMRGTGGVRGVRMRGALVACQVALAMVLLVGAGLLMKSFAELQRLELGVEPENVATFEVHLPDARYGEPERRIQFHQTLQDRLRAIPGVRAAGAISKLPVSGQYHTWGWRWDTPTGPSDWTSIQVRVVEGEYFEALGVDLLLGRTFGPADVSDGRRAAILNESAAEHAFPGGEAIGRSIILNGKPWSVIGVVENVAHDHRGVFTYKMYLPHTQFGDDRNWALTQVVATGTARDDIMSIVRRELATIDPDLVVYNARTMVDVMRREVAQERFALTLMGVFAAVAVLLAAIGMYGVLSYSVSQRTQEIGIRMALGARSAQVRGIVVGHGAVLTAIGITIGSGGALALSRLLNSVVFGISVTDPTIFGTVAAILGGVALLAGYLPARKATRVDPMEALRNE